MDDVDEIITEFLVESHENLDQLDRDLVELEQAPESRPLLASIFRTIHTIKGTSGFLAFAKLERITHVGENLLSRLRDGALALTPERTSALLTLVDAVREILASIEAGTGEGDNDFAGLVEQLALLSEDDPAPVAAAEADVDVPVAVEPVAVEPAAVETHVEDDTLLGHVLVERGAADPQDVELAVREQQDLGDERPIGEILKQYGATTDAEVTQALADQADHRRSVADSTVRVDVDLLDSLMRLVGELVLTRNQIVSFSSSRGDADPGPRVAAAEPDHDRAAGGRHEDAHAADRQRLEQAAPRGARPGPQLRQARCAWRWRAARPSSTRPSSRRSRTR